MTTKPSKTGQPFSLCLIILIYNSNIFKLGVVQPAQQMATAMCIIFFQQTSAPRM